MENAVNARAQVCEQPPAQPCAGAVAAPAAPKPTVPESNIAESLVEAIGSVL